MFGSSPSRSVAALAMAAWALASCSSNAPQGLAEAQAEVGDSAYRLPPAVDVPNFHPYSERVAGGGSPSPAALEQARELGYRSVINLQTSREPGVEAEAAIAAELGLHYVHIPIDSTRVGIKEAYAISQALKEAPDGRVLMHCRSGGRAGAMWGLVEALQAGMSPEQAVAAAKRANLRSDRYMELVHEAIVEANEGN